MKKSKLFKSLFTFSAVFGFGIAGLSQVSEGAEVPVQMLGINDFHGALSTTGSYYGPNEKVSGAGTASLLAGYFNEATKSDAAVYRVQAGDMVGASPANSGLLQDQPTMRVLNQMKFDVGTLGNHEFDEGLAEFNRILLGNPPGKDDHFYDIVDKYNSEIGQEALKGNFDLAIANVKDKMTGANPFGWEDYVIEEKQVGGETVKVGFIGVVTTEIPNLVLAAHHKDYNFTDPAEAIVNSSKKLRDQGVNAIVVLGHTPSVQDGSTATGETANIINTVNQLDPTNSVDAYFAGHNHVYTNGVVGKTRVVQSTSQGKGFINLNGTYDTEKMDFIATPDAEVKAVAPGGATADAEVQKIVDDASERVKAVTDTSIGKANNGDDISRTVNEFGESAVGNLITDGQVYMAKKANIDADFALTNNGGIRDDLKVQDDGTITWGAAQAVQPFGNIMQVVEMTGAQIRTVLNQQTFSYNKETQQYSGYFLQGSGLKYTFSDNQDAATKTEYPYVVNSLTKTDGTPIEDNTTYKLIINDFLYGGGDGFTEFTNAKLISAIDPDTETFIGYIEDLTANGQTIAAAIEGRKTYGDLQNQDVYRVYNPNSGEHFYTLSEGEKNGLVQAGWTDEGTGWQAPQQGDEVYRVYNPNAGDHHYTKDAGERDYLVKQGWVNEGVSFRSGGQKSIYRLYNKNAVAGAHHYTLSQAENDWLVTAGWKAEGIGFNGY
ncbi:5'-nucleotidase C-terminal domain-containing protein [Enterococcus alishanensis]|uniref:5'-nucleotidase C-terminal domain-containing protein n=1 Tax=Enterococcus alishanensis TaxID=1303817 RepID=A0ABS6TBI9_9ENTE|nr:5'-nucleotidase C-terminal domain-containing protein [Enterococcus alishanensis]MBV7390280.1 5'-nucleotidase C-terminal domain-containing protein [Enterococcus alishanensis]